MKVSDLFKQDKQTLSFEFFPPKTEEQEAHLFQVISELKNFNPDFISVTYGAMGRNRDKTFYWAKKIKQEFGIEPVAHLTCVAATKYGIKNQLGELESIGVQNILALRGDPPEGEKDFVPPADGFSYAKELISFIKQNKPQICLGVAGFPEVHPSLKDQSIDIKYLKEKVDAGAEYIITQLFFDNSHFFSFVEKCRNSGITVPVIPGIMPITSVKQIKRLTQICGAKIPQNLLNLLEEHVDDHEAIQKIGVDHAISQCEELLKAKVPGLHFFVMNQSGPVSKIIS